MVMPKKTVAVVGALVIATGALSFSVVDTPVALQATHSISIKNLQFNPGVMDMAVGDTVTWTNDETDGSSPEPTNHNINADDGSFTSPENVAPGQSFSHAPQSAGTITYRCRIHPQTFGELRVSGGNGEAPPPPPQPAPPPPAEEEPQPGLLDGLLGLLPI
ncbi:MAG: hypothetical protein ACRDTG_25770 [Pseudonocardiaceae bacterium]